VLQQRKEIESRIEQLRRFLEDEIQRCHDEADCRGNLDSSHEQ